MATCPKCREHFADGVKFCPKDGEALLIDAAFSGADADLKPGQAVGEYQVEKKVGEGGFGAVYLAVHPLIGKQVAIKVLSREYSSNPQMVSRFIEEARAVNQIRHRNIIDIFSFGQLEDRRQYFVMEYLDGKPFDVVLRERGRLRPEDAIPILRQVARALDAAHDAGIVHRDLKPENVFLNYDEDANPFPKLLDFGIAKLLGESRAGHKTRTGQPIGTPYYMSPEQCLGKSVDHRTDIYSFGVMVHEVLTGKLPFYAEELMNVFVMHMTAQPPRMSSVCPELPPALDEPVLRLLAKQPENRPPSVASGLEALAQAAKDAGFAVEVFVKKSQHSMPGLLGPRNGGRGLLTPAEQEQIAAADTLALGAAHAATSISAPQPAVAAATPLIGTPATALAAAAQNVVAVDVAPELETTVRSRSDSAIGQTGGGSTVTPMAGLDAPARRGGRGVAVAVGVLAVGAAVGITLYVVGRQGSAATGSAPSAATGEPAPTVIATAVPTAVSSVEVAATEIELSVAATPPNVEIYVGDQKLGNAPGPVKLPKGDAPVEVIFRAGGYQQQTIPVVPRANAIVQVKLTKVTKVGGPSGSPTATKTKGELEY